MENESVLIDADVYQYMNEVSLRPNSDLEALVNAAERFTTNPHLSIALDQAQLLQFVLRLIGAKEVLEIGMYAGISALAMAQALPTDGRLTTVELNPQHQEMAEKYWQLAGVKHKIDLQIGFAEPILQSWLDAGRTECFDFIFLDADKRSYDVYYEQSLQLLRAGGLLAIDNVLWIGRMVHTNDGTPAIKALQALNKKLLTDSRIDLVTLPVGSGVSFIRKI